MDIYMIAGIVIKTQHKGCTAIRTFKNRDAAGNYFSIVQKIYGQAMIVLLLCTTDQCNAIPVEYIRQVMCSSVPGSRCTHIAGIIKAIESIGRVCNGTFIITDKHEYSR